MNNYYELASNEEFMLGFFEYAFGRKLTEEEYETIISSINVYKHAYNDNPKTYQDMIDEFGLVENNDILMLIQFIFSQIFS